MSKPDTSHATISPDPETVNVTEFRSRIDHLNRIVRFDYHSSVGAREIAIWVQRAQRIGADLIATTCTRATQADWDKREAAIEASTDQIARGQARLAP